MTSIGNNENEESMEWQCRISTSGSLRRGKHTPLFSDTKVLWKTELQASKDGAVADFSVPSPPFTLPSFLPRGNTPRERPRSLRQPSVLTHLSPFLCIPPAAQQQPKRHSHRQSGQRAKRRQGAVYLRVVASEKRPDADAGIGDDGESP